MKLATVHDPLAHTARPRPARRERAFCFDGLVAGLDRADSFENG